MRPQPLRSKSETELTDAANELARQLSYYATHTDPLNAGWVREQTACIQRAYQRYRRELIRRQRRRRAAL